MFAGSAKMGVCPAGSYSVAPLTDLPVVNPEANSAKGRAGVVTGAGMASAVIPRPGQGRRSETYAPWFSSLDLDAS